MSTSARRKWLLVHPVLGAVLFSGAFSTGGFIVMLVGTGKLTPSLFVTAGCWMATAAFSWRAFRNAPDAPATARSKKVAREPEGRTSS